jgi:hypothetical protein
LLISDRAAVNKGTQYPDKGSPSHQLYSISYYQCFKKEESGCTNWFRDRLVHVRNSLKEGIPRGRGGD